MNNEDHPGIFLNVVPQLNEQWQSLLGYSVKNDTRAIYLIAFRQTLSTAIAKHALLKDENYKEFLKKHKDLPTNPYKRLKHVEFMAWLAVFEMIMRDHGMIRFLATGDDDSGQLGTLRSRYGGGS